MGGTTNQLQTEEDAMQGYPYINQAYTRKRAANNNPTMY